MRLEELVFKLNRVPITIMFKDANSRYTVLYRGESKFCRLTEWEATCLNVEYIKPHKRNNRPV